MLATRTCLMMCGWSRHLTSTTQRTLTCPFILPGLRQRRHLYQTRTTRQSEVRLISSRLPLETLEYNGKDATTPFPVLGDRSEGKDGNEDGNWEDVMAWVKAQEAKDELLPTKDSGKRNNEMPSILPTFNLAAYVNKSECLQELVKLGVNIGRWDRKKKAGDIVVRLDFERDVKPYILFLHDLGVQMEDLGRFFTLNPYIFRETLDDLQTRINYLTCMKFTADQITRIVSRNPYWLLFSTVRIDNRLGLVQRTFDLTDDQVRHVTVREPRLVTYNLFHIKRMHFAVSEEMGFSKEEIKALIMTSPKIWLAHGDALMRRFDYAHNSIGLTHEQITNFPHVLRSRDFRLRQRHSFLAFLGRAQYDPTRPNYVSPKALVEGTDVDFCTRYAKASIQNFNDFLKTL